MGKHSVIVAGVLACASLHVYAGLFDSVSDLTGGIVKIDESDPSKEDASANAVSAHKAKIYSKKMSTSEYIAARDAFIDMVAKKYGASASAFNIHNKDFGEIREYFPEEAEKFAQSAGRLRGAAFSELKFTSDKKDGIKLLNKLSKDEAEISAMFASLKNKVSDRQIAENESQAARLKAEAEKDRGDVLYRNFNISKKIEEIKKLTSIAISLGAESNGGLDKFMSSIPKKPQGDYSNGGRMKPDEVEKWIAETGPVIESRILDLKSRLELNNDGRAFLEKIQRAEGRNDNNTPFPVFSWKGEEGTSASIKLGMTPFEIFRELKNMDSAGVLSKIDMPRKAFIKADGNAYGDKLSLEFDYVPVSEKGPEVLAMAVMKFDRLEYMPPMEPVKEKYRKLLPNATEGAFFLPTGETYLDEEGLKKDGSWDKLQELYRQSKRSELQWHKENTEAAFQKSLIETQRIEKQQQAIIKAHTVEKKMECPMLVSAGYEVIMVWEKNRPVVSQIIFIDRKLLEATKEISDKKQKAAAAAAKAKAEAEAKAKLEKQLDF